jgi:hypothetical protein
MKQLLLCLALTACAATDADLPSRTYDFAPRKLAALPTSGTTLKTQPLVALRTARAAIAACVTTPQTIELTWTLDLDAPPRTAAVTVAGDAALASCVRAAVLGADLSAITPADSPQRLIIELPLMVDPAYTAAQ